MNMIYAFTDESGNCGFDFEKSDVSSYFIVTAIIVEEGKVAQVEKEIENIRSRYFQTGEIKSSSVGKNHARRMTILKEILKSDFKIFAVVVDKKRIYEDSGLMYKKTFYKFINNLVHKELRDAFSRLTICSDQLGGNEYMLSFSKYVKEREESANLLDEREFYFKDSRSSVMIQLADFICGTISFMYEKAKQEINMPNYLEVLEKLIIRIEHWPKNIETYTSVPNCINAQYDCKIAELCCRQAQSFIKRNINNSDEEIINQLIVLKYLCFRFINNDTRQYIPTKELINRLSYKTGEKVSVHYFRSTIIAKLRDAGVIISSSSKGYKIPSRECELYDFINHGVSVIIPMLERLKKCRDTVKLATRGEIDLFEQDEYVALKKYFASEDIQG